MSYAISIFLIGTLLFGLVHLFRVRSIEKLYEHFVLGKATELIEFTFLELVGVALLGGIEVLSGTVVFVAVFQFLKRQSNRVAAMLSRQGNILPRDSSDRDK